MDTFTAQNSAILDKQIANFAKKHTGFTFHYGKNSEGWYCTTVSGQLSTGLTFAAIIDAANHCADTQISWEGDNAVDMKELLADTFPPYTLVMLNGQGASKQTRNHASKADVRRQIRTWNAKDMTARVFDSEGCMFYNGPALSF